MANVTIGDLSGISQLSGDDLIEVETEDGISAKTSINQIREATTEGMRSNASTPPFQIISSVSRWAALRGRELTQIESPHDFNTPTNQQAGRITHRSPYDRDEPMLLCIYIGGVGGNTDLEPPAAYMSTLNDGVVWARCQFSGNDYGAQRSLQDIRDVYNIVCATVPVAGVVLVANSMGSMVALNAITNNVLPGILGVYLTDPVTNLEWSSTGPRAEMIRAAYGISTDGSDYEEKTRGYDPNLRHWTDFKGIPIHIIGSTGDTTVPFDLHGQLLASKLIDRQDVTLVTLTTPGHSRPDRLNVELLRNFLIKVSGIALNTTPAEVITILSDSFNRTGNLFGSDTDSHAGGETKTWGGTSGNNVTTEEVNGGQVVIASTVVFSHCVDAGSPDVEMEFTLVTGPDAASGYNSIVDLRKASAATGSCVRMIIHSHDEVTQSSVAQLAYRVGTTGTLLGTTFTIDDGSRVKLRVEGNTFSCFVDEVMVQEADVTVIPTGNFCGFAGSSGNRPWVVSDLIIRQI